jgi:amylosucrase
MYEQVSHSLLNDILISLKPDIKNQKLQHFYTRLGSNFYAIHSLFSVLYGDRADFNKQMLRLVETLAHQYIKRPAALKRMDLAREKDHNWFLSQHWAGMALYSGGFAGNLKVLKTKLHYLQELGINMVHIMPILDCPPGKSDGGYAVRDFRKLDARIGTINDISILSANLKKRDILLTLDIVVNHTSYEHEWATQARHGNQMYQDYYYIFDDREMPDMFEESMPEIFPETSPGNFTWDEDMGKWVMTVFHDYQWDLNYRNPAVFIEIVDIILFWANQGADILRLDAVAFLWKKIGSTCQNEREAHLLLQLMKDCCQVTAPGVLFIAEAIVAPVEIAKYFGEDAINAKECEIAYNATFMALLWEALATKNTKLLNIAISNLPDKLERATWLNYVRSHDDIGFGFSDTDIQLAGYDPKMHRRFLVDYYTGKFDTSPARGKPFGQNNKNDDARISGSLASLAGLESALEDKNPDAIEAAIQKILLLHSLILSFGGIPLFYYGDEIGTLNNYAYLEDESKCSDSRWLQRPKTDWSKAELRNQPGTVENHIFSNLKKMVALRKEIPAFADYNNRELLDVNNPHLFVFLRFDPQNSREKIMVIANFDDYPQPMNFDTLHQIDFFQHKIIMDICSGKSLSIQDGKIIIPPLSFYWLSV